MGSGDMTKAVAGRIAKAGHIVEIVNRDSANARALADRLAAGAPTGTYGTVPAGDIVILTMPYRGIAAVGTDFGEALNGKVFIDVANPLPPTSRTL
nr:NAD(P)-binding domain-containing protein [Ochrobactrum vermis]